MLVEVKARSFDIQVLEYKSKDWKLARVQNRRLLQRSYNLLWCRIRDTSLPSTSVKGSCFLHLVRFIQLLHRIYDYGYYSPLFLCASSSLRVYIHNVIFFLYFQNKRQWIWGLNRSKYCTHPLMSSFYIHDYAVGFWRKSFGYLGEHDNFASKR
jgi:hypothetical protein